MKHFLFNLFVFGCLMGTVFTIALDVMGYWR